MEAIAEQLDLITLNQIFEKSEPTKVVEWAVGQFGERVVMSSSFGADSATLIHMAIQHKPEIKIIFTDTGYHFPETHAFLEQLRARFNLNVWTYRTRNDPFAYLHHAGEENPEWRNDRDRCCGENKDEPFDRAMRELAPQGWLRGIRRDQSQTRKNANFVTWDKKRNCYAISPLLNMSTRDIFNYMKQHDLPHHPLYDKGYPSVGCNPHSCTRPIQIGDDHRSGRWAGTGKVECGINLGSLDTNANEI